MRRLAIAGVMSAVTFGLAAHVQADSITVRLSDGITTVSCADESACDAASGFPGVVAYTSVLGTVTVSGATGSGPPALADLNMDLAYNLTQGVTSPAKTYTIEVSENNLNTSDQQWEALVNGNQSPGTTTAFNAYADASNTLFGQGTTLCNNGPVGTPSVSFTCGPTPIVPFNGNTFSLTEKVTIKTVAGRATASGDATLTVPEPATMFLAGAGLIALGYAARRRLFGR